MSSTATSVVPNIFYHLPKPITQNFQHFGPGANGGGSMLEFNTQSSLSSTSASDYASKTGCYTTKTDSSSSSISTSKLVSYNLDAALRLSLKSSSSTVPSNSSSHISGSTASTSTEKKLPQRPLSFHESSAPPLDSLIRQKIQSLPRSLILTDSKEEDKKGREGESKPTEKYTQESKLLCTDEELDHLCRTGAQYIPRRALGFGNSGNTCYLNSVLQCILATGPLLAYIHSKHSNSNNCPITSTANYNRSTLPNVNKSRFCVLCGLARLLSEHRSQSGGHTVPSYFVTNVRAVCPSLRPYQQEDAHEFLLGLLSRMEDGAMAGLGKIPRKISETNVIRRIFGGVMRSEVTCHSCHKVSARDEQWFNLSMDITCARSLQQCLYNYIRSEELSGQNAYKCENCRQLRPAMRRSTVYRAPPILIIQFNRFSRHQKLDMRVDFPSSFNLRPFMTQSKGSPVLYKLYATVNHEGYSCRSGHYVSFTQRHGQWLSHNDSFISTTSLDHVSRQYPYLLFYEMIRNPANSTPNGMTTTPAPSTTTSTTTTTSSSQKLSSNNTLLSQIQQQQKQKSIVIKTFSSPTTTTTTTTTLTTRPPLPTTSTSSLVPSMTLITAPTTTTTTITSANLASLSRIQTTNALSNSNVNLPSTPSWSSSLSSASSSSSVPKIVFNPKISLNKFKIIPSPAVSLTPSTSSSTITTSTTATTANSLVNSPSYSSKSKSYQDSMNCNNNNNCNKSSSNISTIPLPSAFTANSTIAASVTTTTSSTVPVSVSLSSSTVRQLLYGKENQPELWSERPTPLQSTVTSSFGETKHQNHRYNNQHSTTDSSRSSLSSSNNPCRQIDNHHRSVNETKVAKIDCSAQRLPTVVPHTTDSRNNGETHKHTRPLVDYQDEKSDNDSSSEKAATLLSPPSKRRYKSSSSSSDSDSGIVWIPLNAYHEKKPRISDSIKSLSSSSDRHSKHTGGGGSGAGSNHNNNNSSNNSKRHKKKHKSHSSKHSSHSRYDDDENDSGVSRHHTGGGDHHYRRFERSRSRHRDNNKHRHHHHHDDDRRDSMNYRRRDSLDSRYDRRHSHHNKHHKRSHENAGYR